MEDIMKKGASQQESSRQTVRLEPISVSVAVSIPWYQRLWRSGLQTQTVWKLTLVFLFAVGITVGYYVQNPTNTVSRAGTSQAKISVFPASVSMPPAKIFQIWMTAGSPVETATFAVVFDPSILALADNITIPDKNATIVFRSPVAQANNTGTLNVVVSWKTPPGPSHPSGTFLLANVPFVVATKRQDLTTSLTVTVADSGIVNISHQPFTVKATSSAILVNPTTPAR
jgi:hypothetical protein